MKKNTITTLVLISALLLAGAFAFTGCGSGDTESGGEEPAASSEEQASADAADEVAGTETVPDDVRDPFQNQIAGIVSVVIVEFFKVIDVYEKKSHAAGVHVFPDQFISSTVVEAGERIVRSGVPEPFPGVLVVFQH